MEEDRPSGQTLGSAEGEAWRRIVQSANVRVASYGTGYTIKRLTADDAAHIAELLRVSIDNDHYLAWHPKLREIREKMIERMGDIYKQERTP